MVGPVGQKRKKRRIAALISPLSVVALLFALSLITLPALAMGHSSVVASEILQAAEREHGRTSLML